MLNGLTIRGKGWGNEQRCVCVCGGGGGYIFFLSFHSGVQLSKERILREQILSRVGSEEPLRSLSLSLSHSLSLSVRLMINVLPNFGT